MKFDQCLKSFLYLILAIGFSVAHAGAYEDFRHRRSPMRCGRTRSSTSTPSTPPARHR